MKKSSSLFAVATLLGAGMFIFLPISPPLLEELLAVLTFLDFVLFQLFNDALITLITEFDKLFLNPKIIKDLKDVFKGAVGFNFIAVIFAFLFYISDILTFLFLGRFFTGLGTLSTVFLTIFVFLTRHYLREAEENSVPY